MTLARTFRAVPTQLNAAIRRIRFRLELPRKVASTIMVTSFGSSTKILITPLDRPPKRPFPAANVPITLPKSNVRILLDTPTNSVCRVPQTNSVKMS